MSDFFAPAWWVGGNPFAAGAADLGQNAAAMQAQQAEQQRIAALSAQHQATIQQTTGNLTQDPAHYAAVGAAYGRNTGGFNGGAAFQPGAFGTPIDYGPDYGPLGGGTTTDYGPDYGPLGGGTSTPYGPDYGPLPSGFSYAPDPLERFRSGTSSTMPPLMSGYPSSQNLLGYTPDATLNASRGGESTVPKGANTPFDTGASPTPYTPGTVSGQHAPGSWGEYTERFLSSGIHPDTLYRMYQNGQTPGDGASGGQNITSGRNYEPAPAQPMPPEPSYPPPQQPPVPQVAGGMINGIDYSGDPNFANYMAMQQMFGGRRDTAAFNDRFHAADPPATPTERVEATPGIGATIPGQAQLPPVIFDGGYPKPPPPDPLQSFPTPQQPPAPSLDLPQQAPGGTGWDASGYESDPNYQNYLQALGMMGGRGGGGSTVGSRDSIANTIVAQGGDDFDAYNFQSPSNSYSDFQKGATYPWTSSIPRNRYDPNTMNAVYRTAGSIGVDPAALAAMIGVESNWDPTNATGSYRGMTQMGPEPFREAGGKLGGLTWDQYRRASGADQVNAYEPWLQHYANNSPDNAASLVTGGIGSLPPPMQAAIMQGTQFAPNAQSWVQALGQGNMSMPTTPSSQAAELGNTSINDMYNAYVDRMGQWQTGA